jgi:hypothetical protein
MQSEKSEKKRVKRMFEFPKHKIHQTKGCYSEVEDGNKPSLAPFHVIAGRGAYFAICNLHFALRFL